MDMLYQLYANFFKGFGIADEGLILAFWCVLLFGLTCISFFTISGFLFHLDKKLFKLMYEYKNIPSIDFNYINTNNLLIIILLSGSIFLWGIIPYSNKYIPINSNISLLLFITTLNIFLFITLLGMKKNNKNCITNIIFNIFSFGMPIFFSLLSVVFLSSSYNLNDIVLAQALTQNTTGWLITPAVIGFFVYILGLVCLFSFIEKSLNFAGFCLYKISNYKIKILWLCYYSLIFILSAYGVCLFLGGYLPPLGFYASEVFKIHYQINTNAVYLEQIFWFLIKTILLVIFILGLKIKLIDTPKNILVKFSWTVLFPASLLNLIICMIIPLLGGR